MDRYIKKHLLEYADKKIILLTGPRQVGKTTLTKSLNQSLAYYNYDVKDNFEVFQKSQWDRSKKLVVFDELHIKKNWKNWLKGIYDNGELKNQQIVVTGSSRLDISKKMGDSLAGRFFSYQLNPLDLDELKGTQSTEKNYYNLLNYSGFPEPFFEASEKFYNQWKKSHLDMILRQDLLNFEVVKDIDTLEMMVELVSTQISSTTSYKSLAEDLQKDEKTIKNWLRHLENLYVLFRLNPYHHKLKRSLTKTGKYYFYDICRVRGSTVEQKEAAQLENLVALSLKKYIDFQNDVFGKSYDLQFIKFTDQKEIDFVVLEKNIPKLLIEVKLSDSSVSKSFNRQDKALQNIKKIQLVKNLKREFSTPSGIKIIRCLDYLENIDFDL